MVGCCSWIAQLGHQRPMPRGVTDGHIKGGALSCHLPNFCQLLPSTPFFFPHLLDPFPDSSLAPNHPCDIGKPSPAPSIAFNSRERPPSSSPLPEMESSSSSSLSHSYEQSERQPTVKLRRYEVVDGQHVWISESPRRRRRKVPKYHPLEDANRCPSSLMDTGIAVVRDGSYGLPEKRPTLDSSLLPVSDHLQPAPPSSKRSVADQVRQHGSIVSTSEIASKLMDDRADLTSPPPTPKITRLKTPDLPPLKMRLFCDCQPCQQTSCGTKRVIVHSDGGIPQPLWP
jgi:hypothetical protein